MNSQDSEIVARTIRSTKLVLCTRLVLALLARYADDSSVDRFSICDRHTCYRGRHVSFRRDGIAVLYCTFFSMAPEFLWSSRRLPIHGIIMTRVPDRTMVNHDSGEDSIYLR
jgi:hypothetical protein